MLYQRLDRRNSIVEREINDNVYKLYKQINVDFTPSQKLLFFILEAKKLSSRNLAIKINISDNVMKNLLKGKTKNPHMKTFNKIFEVYCQVYGEYVSHEVKTILD